MICIGRHVGGHTLALQHGLEDILLPSNMAAKTTFWLYLVKRLIVTLRCAVNVTTSSFQLFACVQKGVIHNFKNYILVTWPARNLLILITLILFKIWPGADYLNYPLIVFRRKNHITFIFTKKRCHMTSLCKWPIPLRWDDGPSPQPPWSNDTEERVRSLTTSTTETIGVI